MLNTRTSTYQNPINFFVNPLQNQKSPSEKCVNAYTFGFNGQEKDDEVAGAGNSMTAEHWQYDTRLARRWNVDPVYKPDVSNYSVLSNNPIIMVDPKGDDDYYNRKGQYLGSVGENNGVMRVVNTEDLYKQATATGNHQGREIIVQSRTIANTIAAVAASTQNTGNEYSMNIIFDPDKAIITAEIDFGAIRSGGYCEPEAKISYDQSHGGKVLIGTLHGHPELNKIRRTITADGGSRVEHETNAYTTSPDDRKYAKNNGVVNYAIDAQTKQQTSIIGGTGQIHRANPDGTTNDNIGQLNDVTSGNLNIGKQTMEISGGKK